MSLALTVPASRAEADHGRWSISFSYRGGGYGRPLPPPPRIAWRGRAFRHGYREGYRHGYHDGVHAPRVVHYGPPAPVYYSQPAYAAPPVRVITTAPVYYTPPACGTTVHVRW